MEERRAHTGRSLLASMTQPNKYSASMPKLKTSPRAVLRTARRRPPPPPSSELLRTISSHSQLSSQGNAFGIATKFAETNAIPSAMTGIPSTFHQLDGALKEFYDHHNVEIDSLLLCGAPRTNNDDSSPVNPFRYRFVRLNPRYKADDTLRLLKHELNGSDPIHVPWLPEDTFYALPAHFSLSSSECFQSGRLYGMDVSSGAAVSALLSESHDKTSLSSDDDSKTKQEEPAIRVLDLCCCPGLKLCAIADQVPSGSIVVGVDVSLNRMALCTKIVQKYHIDNATSGRQRNDLAQSTSSSLKNKDVKIQLYCQDGTTFGTAGLDHIPVFDSRVALEEETTRGSRKRKNKSARARERKRLKQIAADELFDAGPRNCDDSTTTTAPEGDNSTSSPHIGPINPAAALLFDRILVDAECSTDGSLKHLRESLKEATASTPHTANPMLTDRVQLSELLALQRRLLAAGYRLLKPGGTLVYSTCSLSQDQNENIVQWLLDECGDAYVIPVQFAVASSNKLVVEGSIGGTVRFYPNLSQDAGALFGDGFFLAKIGKRATKT